MKIVHIVHGKANPEGHNGISRVVYHLNKQEKAQGINSQIWAIVDDARTHYTHRRDEFVTVECYPRVRTPFGTAEIIEQLKAQKDQIDVVHFHLIWFYDKNIIAKALKKLGIPFIITTHGTYLKPHALTGKRLVAKYLFERRFLNAATEIHAITDEESEKLAEYGCTRPSFVAPNGIALEEVPDQRRTDYFGDRASESRTRLIWIGVKRDDKNLESLVRAVGLLPDSVRKTLIVHLAGPNYKGNEESYRRLASELGVGDHFEFAGPIYGQDKYDALESSDIHILPSLSEVFSLAMLDAMACGKPCLVSNGCGYENWRKDDFFVSFETDPASIASAIEEMLAKRSEWPRMGENARRVIERDLNWHTIAGIMIENYRRIAGR